MHCVITKMLNREAGENPAQGTFAVFGDKISINATGELSGKALIFG